MSDLGGSDNAQDELARVIHESIFSNAIDGFFTNIEDTDEDFSRVSRRLAESVEAVVVRRVAEAEAGAGALGRRMDSLGAELERAMKRLNDVGNVDTQYAQHNQLLRAVEVCAGAVRAFALAVDQEGESK